MSLKSAPLSRRQFVQVTSAGVLVAACGDDAAAPRDTLEAEAEATAEVIEEVVPVEIEVASETIIDVAPEIEVEPEVSPEVDTGPTPIGTFDPTELTAAPRAAYLYGVQAGDPNSDGAVLWTCTTGTELEVVVFANGAVDEAGDLFLRTAATVAEGGFVHVEVSGLAPDTRYRYCFVAGGQRSPVGRFRTALANEAARVVTFGGTSCVNLGYKPYRTLNRAADANLDFFILGGDTTYCDGAETLDDYREMWRQSFDTDGYRGLLGSTGVYATWDDHEIDDDWDPERTRPEKIATAKRTYLDHIACRTTTEDPVEDWKLWRSYRWGKTVEVFMLDCRGERLPSTRLTANAQYLSKQQMDWLKLGLRRSPCTFKLIVNSVPITNMPINYPIEKDRWEGYENQRLEILQFIDGPPILPGVLWLSGDFHFGCVARVEAPPNRFSNQWEVFMGQGANMSNPAWEPLRDTAANQLPFVTGTNNFVRFTCDPFAEPPRITAEFIDGDGTVFHTHTFDFPVA